MLLHFQNPTCTYNHPYNLHEKSFPLLQSTFTSLFPCFLTKSSLQSTLTLPSSIPQYFFHLPTFACNHPNNLHQKCFPYLNHLPNSGCVKEQRSYGVLWAFLIFPFFLKVWAVIAGLTITDSSSFRLIKLVYCR